MSGRPPLGDDELVVLLRQISSQLDALPARLAAAMRGAPVDAASANLLKAAWAACADRVFTSADLVAHAEVNEPLRAAIVAACGALNPRRTGKTLRKLEGLDADGLCVRRVGDDRDGVLWAVASLRVSNPR